MWSMPWVKRNLENCSEENGHPLSKKKCWGCHIARKTLVSIGCYCQWSWNEL